MVYPVASHILEGTKKKRLRKGRRGNKRPKAEAKKQEEPEEEEEEDDFKGRDEDDDDNDSPTEAKAGAAKRKASPAAVRDEPPDEEEARDRKSQHRDSGDDNNGSEQDDRGAGEEDEGRKPKAAPQLPIVHNNKGQRKRKPKPPPLARLESSSVQPEPSPVAPPQPEPQPPPAPKPEETVPNERQQRNEEEQQLIAERAEIMHRLSLWRIKYDRLRKRRKECGLPEPVAAAKRPVPRAGPNPVLKPTPKQRITPWAVLGPNPDADSRRKYAFPMDAAPGEQSDPQPAVRQPLGRRAGDVSAPAEYGLVPNPTRRHARIPSSRDLPPVRPPEGWTQGQERDRSGRGALKRDYDLFIKDRVRVPAAEKPGEDSPYRPQLAQAGGLSTRPMRAPERGVAAPYETLDPRRVSRNGAEPKRYRSQMRMAAQEMLHCQSCFDDENAFAPYNLSNQ